MSFIPYHRPLISESEIKAVEAVMRSGWLTAGKKVEEFESAFSAYKGGPPASAVNSCTSGLFLITRLLGLQPGDEVITTPLTFAATANVIVQNGGIPVFADVDPHTWNIHPGEVFKNITSKTKAVICVHLGGNPCAMNSLIRVCNENQVTLIEDCAHAVEGSYLGQPLGTFGWASAFSFYPTKNITAGEGGMVLAKEKSFIAHVSQLRHHGIDRDAWNRQSESDYRFYDVLEPGFKMNMTDIQAAIGLEQLRHLKEWNQRRKEIAAHYDTAFTGIPGLVMQQHTEGGEHALHLYMLRIDKRRFSVSRNELLRQIQEAGVQVSVNYKPLHEMTFYRETYDLRPDDFPYASMVGESVFSLPFYPGLTDAEVNQVAETVKSVLLRNSN